MPEDLIVLKYHDVIEALIKKANLHEGIWGLNVEFGLGAGNVQGPKGVDDIVPAAIIPVVSLGLRKYPAEGPLALDAAKVNPAPKGIRSHKRKKASEILTGT